MEQVVNNIILPRRSRQGHKGTYGTVLGIGGSRGMAGARCPPALVRGALISWTVY